MDFQISKFTNLTSLRSFSSFAPRQFVQARLLSAWHRFQIILLTALLFLSTTAGAQSRRLPSTGYGFKGGVTIASYNIEGNILGFEEKLSHPVVGYHAGVTARWASGSIPLTVKLEAIYNSAKLRIERGRDTSSLEVTSFSFPLLAGLNIEAFGSVPLNIHAGPVFNLSSRTRLGGEEKWYLTELFRKPSLGIAAGASISFWRRMIFEVRYNFYPATRSVEIPDSGTARSDNWSSWNIGVGMMF